MKRILALLLSLAPAAAAAEPLPLALRRGAASPRTTS